MKNPIPGIQSFEQEEALFDAKRHKMGPCEPYPIVYGKPYKGSITVSCLSGTPETRMILEKVTGHVSSDEGDTRPKVCDVQTPIEHLKDCSPKCSAHPDRASRGVYRVTFTQRGKQKWFWNSGCVECMNVAFDNDQPIRWHSDSVHV